MQAIQLFLAMATTTLQELQQGEGCEPRVLPRRGPNDRPEGQHGLVHVKEIDEVARLVSTRKRDNLVDGEVDPV